MSVNRIRILAVDDHAILRDGIAALIGTQQDMEVVAEAGNGAEAIEQFFHHIPDITLMDLALPDMSGVDAISRIRETHPRAKIIVLTTFRGDVQAVRCLRAGASGFLLKSMLRKELLDAIRSVHQGARYLPAEISAEIATFACEEPLSNREIEVLQCVAQGCANKIIADQLQISEDTVKSHMRNILAKLAANDRTHAVMIATRRGFLDLRP